MSALGFKMDFRNGDNFRELVIKDHHKYGAVIRDAAIQLD
jgi:hypothetical protein